MPHGEWETEHNVVHYKTQPCVVCKKVTSLDLPLNEFQRWQGGEHIQDVWPEKTLMERETLISGTCSDECWDKLWGVEEE
jgi:hypothetical protein